METRFEAIEREDVLALRKFDSGLPPRATAETAQLPGQVAKEVNSRQIQILSGLPPQATAETVQATGPVAKEVKSSQIQLERLKLDKFDCNIRKYPAFRERFNIYIGPMCPRS